jgi:hypothetical protein
MVSRWELEICFPECVAKFGEVFDDFNENLGMGGGVI